MTPLTLSFGRIRASDLAKVGGKGANLGELTRAGFNVPPGFCVSTDAYASFMSQVEMDIFACLDEITTSDIEGLRQAGRKVRAHLAEISLPSAVVDAVVEAWRGLGEGDAYAVRSSATAEDLPHASFAGQQDTFLNVRGRDALLDSVKACFISLFTDRAILYRIQNNFNHRVVALSVVVQRMVQPEVSGILFTAEPVTGNRNIISIDASFGLGEALVAGLVSADLYQVDKQSNQIIFQKIASKQIEVRSLLDGGTEQVELAEDERMQASLTDDQVRELARLGMQIEAHYGVPQDIEWAISDKSVYVIQSRPITSLYPLPEQDDGAFRVYASVSHFQMMTDAMPPLALSLLRTLLPLGHADGRLESKYILDVGGRIYGDVSPILRHPIGRRALPRIFRNVDELGALGIAELANHHRLRASNERMRLPKIAAVYPLIRNVVHALFREEPRGATIEASNLIDGHIAATRNKINAAPDSRTKLAIALQEMRHIFAPAFTWAPKLIAGILASVLVKILIGKRVGEQYHAALERGLIGNVATEMSLAVGDLTDAASSSDALASNLRQTTVDAKTRLANAADLPGGQDFLHLWRDFIQAYGSRGPAEVDLSRPRWHEDPTTLLQMVVGPTSRREPGTHRVHYQKLIEEGEEAAANLVRVAQKGVLGWVRGPLVRRLIRVGRAFAPLREHHKFLVVQFLAVIKPIFLEVGDQLHAEGRIDSPDDIWFLTFPEVLKVFEHPDDDLIALVRKRRTAFEHYQHLNPPRVMSSDGVIPVVKLAGRQAPGGALVGSPVSAGVVEGVARVVFDPGTDVLAPGEILVASFTDPGWTPLFANAAGLVAEVGGLMSHGSVVAREYGIPAVVGVTGATEQIKSGQRVRVHGDAGYVEILGDQKEVGST